MSFFNIPVAIIIYNREKQTKLLIEQLRKIQPTDLYIIADGPHNEQDVIKCRNVQQLLTTINWPCVIHKNISPVNLGCRNRVVSGLNWLFEHVEYAIILEDDCIPHQRFFYFAEAMLNKYKDVENIMHVSGTNFLAQSKSSGSYFFSKYPHVWGWATWKRAWKKYDQYLFSWEKHGGRVDFEDSLEKNNVLNNYFSYHRTTWDIQWTYCCLMHKGLAIIPETNLIINHGDEGTNTFIQHLAYLARLTRSLPIPEIGAGSIFSDTATNSRQYDQEYFDLFFSRNPVFQTAFKARGL